jgi:hypothetical protein
MTQEEIDALLQSIANEKDMVDEKYHKLICIYCKHITDSTTLDMHVLLTPSLPRCSNSTGHMYVSEEWLLDRRKNKIPGWRRKDKVKSDPRIRKVAKSK